MKLLLKVLTLAVFTLLLTSQFAAHAQGPGGGGFGGGPNRLNGTVTAIDTTANTITVQPRGQDATPTTVSINSTTKYTKVTTVPLTSLAVGNIISAGGRQPIDPAATTVDASRIQILDTLPKAPATPNPNYQPRNVSGTILTTTPSLTIKTDAGTTITVNTTDTTQVSKTIPAAVTDVAVGNNVNIETKTDGTTVTAVAVHVVPARMRRGGGAPGGQAPPPAAAPAVQ